MAVDVLASRYAQWWGNSSITLWLREEAIMLVDCTPIAALPGYRRAVVLVQSYRLQSSHAGGLRRFNLFHQR